MNICAFKEAVHDFNAQIILKKIVYHNSTAYYKKCIEFVCGVVESVCDNTRILQFQVFKNKLQPCCEK